VVRARSSIAKSTLRIRELGIDEGRSLEIGFQEQVSNRLQAAAVKELWWCALEEKCENQLVQVSIRETSESEP